jgi:hypothetical protein
MPNSDPRNTYAHEQRTICAICGRPLSPMAKYCPNCGSPVLSDDDTQDTLLVYPSPTAPLKRKPLVPPSTYVNEEKRTPQTHIIIQVLPSGTCLTVDVRKPVILGRSSTQAQNVVDLTAFNALEHGVSRRHCKLELKDGQLLISDLKSSNGTYLNDKHLVPHQKYVVLHGDRLILGTLHLTVEYLTLNDDSDKK